jgi:adenylosuccinate synthase
MKMDVLSGMKEIKVCTAYELDGQVIKDYPVSPGDLERVKPVYESLSGWNEDITTVKNVKDLPRNAQDYIQFIGKELATPIDVVSVGPGREQTLWLKPLFT